MTSNARLLLISLIAAALITLTGCGTNDRFNAWLTGCAAEGGQAALVSKGDWSDHYECFRDGEVVVVPGYEGTN